MNHDIRILDRLNTLDRERYYQRHKPVKLSRLHPCPRCNKPTRGTTIQVYTGVLQQTHNVQDPNCGQCITEMKEKAETIVDQQVTAQENKIAN